MVTDVGREELRVHCRLFVVWSQKVRVVIIAVVIAAPDTHAEYQKRTSDFVKVAKGKVGEPSSNGLVFAKVMADRYYAYDYIENQDYCYH